MSWDVLLLRLPDDVALLRDIPEGCVSPPLGRRGEVLAKIAEAVPAVDLSDPTWGELDGPTWSVELSIGSEDPVESIMLHIRGAGDDVLIPVVRLAEMLRCRAVDLADGNLIAAGGTAGWHAFQQFRDRGVGPLT